MFRAETLITLKLKKFYLRHALFSLYMYIGTIFMHYWLYLQFWNLNMMVDI